jgi:hypothetical protein
MKRFFFVIFIFTGFLVNNAELKAQSHEEKSSITFNTRVARFGQLSYNEKRDSIFYDFVFTVDGSSKASPVKILSVNPSCTCTAPAYTREALKPGDTGFIRLSTSVEQLFRYRLIDAVVKTDSKNDFHLLVIKAEE